MRTRQKRFATDTWRSLGYRTTPLEHWSKRKSTVEHRWAKQQTKKLRPQPTKINSFLCESSQEELVFVRTVPNVGADRVEGAGEKGGGWEKREGRWGGRKEKSKGGRKETRGGRREKSGVKNEKWSGRREKGPPCPTRPWNASVGPHRTFAPPPPL